MTEANSIVAIFERLLSEGKDKNQIILGLVSEGSLDVTTAVREYNSLAKRFGLVMDSKERTAKINEFLAQQDPNLITNSETRRELCEQLQIDYDLSYATAYQHIRKYCESAGIELPSATRNSFEDVLKFIKDAFEQEWDRDKIIQGLTDELGYTKNSANSAYSRATRELGLATGNAGPKAELSEVVAHIRKHEHLPKKEAVRKLCEDLGYAESTANSFYVYLNFAKEYSKQEMEAANAKTAA